MIIASMLGLALPTALAATASNLGQLIAWRFLTGLFIPGVTAVAIAYVGEESPAELAGLTMGTYVTGMAIGGFAGRFLTGLFATWWRWRVAFLCLGAITFAAALTTWGSCPALQGSSVKAKLPLLSSLCALIYGILSFWRPMQ